MATTYNISTYNNDTYGGCIFEIIVNGVAANLTGATIKMQVRKTRDSSPVLTFELTDGLTIVDAINGKFKIDEQIISAVPDIYLYDIEITFADNSVKTYVKGTFTVIGDITHNG